MGTVDSLGLFWARFSSAYAQSGLMAKCQQDMGKAGLFSWGYGVDGPGFFIRITMALCKGK